jgi:Amt family ammonium transporter
VLGAITGAVAGLATVTPASGFVNIWGALAIGVIAGTIPWIFVSILKPRLGYDDSLDAFGVHGIGGVLGALATGVFADAAINGKAGLFYGNPGQMYYQFFATGVSLAYSFIMTLALLKLVDMVMPLRASEKEETIGLDVTQHRETAYTVID